MNANKTTVIPILLSGGIGKRLWPLSRANYPKQFLKLYNCKTLIQNTILRCSQIPFLSKPILVCNKNDRFNALAQINEIHASIESILLEPESRNTAPAISAAMLFAIQCYGDGVLLIMPVDHKIDDIDAFTANLETGIEYALQDKIVVFGVKPTSTDCNYGYIEVADHSKTQRAYTVKSFKEKPTKDVAEKLISDNHHYWNAGIFLVKASRLVSEFNKLQPEILAATRQSYNDASNDGVYQTLNERAYQQCPSISIDYAIIEKTSNITMIPLTTPWKDIGNWQSLYDMDKKDENGNVIHGNVATVDTINSYLHTESKLVATIGMEDCYVIETPDATLITNKEHLNQLGDLVTFLEREHRTEVATSTTVNRPWGYYTSIECSVNYQIKKIVIFPQQSLSLQDHQYRSEHWVILKGKAKVTLGHDLYTLNPNESIFVPIGMKHRIENEGESNLELIEIQTGTYLGEDDIKRYEDLYHREGNEA